LPFYTDEEGHCFSSETKQYVVFNKGKSECEDHLGTEIQTYTNDCTHNSVSIFWKLKL